MHACTKYFTKAVCKAIIVVAHVHVHISQHTFTRDLLLYLTENEQCSYGKDIEDIYEKVCEVQGSLTSNITEGMLSLSAHDLDLPVLLI